MEAAAQPLDPPSPRDDAAQVVLRALVAWAPVAAGIALYEVSKQRGVEA